MIDSIAGAIRHSEGMSNRQSRLIDGLYGQEKINDLDRLVDILFDELGDRRILEQVALKLLTLSKNENRSKSIEADLATTIDIANTDKHPEIVDLNPIPTIAPSVKDIDTETGLSLTPDQSAALEMMKQFVQAPRQKYFRLTGYAGTGKSYLIVQLMKWLLNQKVNFVAGSPTKQRVAQIVV